MTEAHANGRINQWTEEKVKELNRLIDTGHSGNQIALILGATRNAVVGKVHRLGRRMSGEPYTPAITNPRRVRPRLMIYRTYAAFAPEYDMCAEATQPKEVSTSDPCDLMGLTTQTCHWPLWNDHDAKDKKYCGAPSAGKVYCKEHATAAMAIRRKAANPQPFLLP
jgi:hypothetical protein